MMLEDLTRKANRKGITYYEDENGIRVAKNCTNCRNTKLLIDFPQHKRRPDGHAAQCKVCVYGKNRDYVSENYEKVAEYKSRFYKTNKEKEDARAAKWRDENRERHNQRGREYKRNWRRDNPDKMSLEKHRRRARESSLPDTFTHEQLNEILTYFNGGCALTGDTSVFHWDHVIPLSTGCGGTVYGNMIPLRADLNMSKSAANIFEWFKLNKERFNLPQDNFDSLIMWLATVNDMTVEEYRDFVYECHEFKLQPTE
jgi:hypothetical protein